ncbi:hypothetical protein DJ568_06905 [Mucilaginibacter hurinus]|uniref:Peptidase M23 domain-containing protein n=1 Tax=Mucilaginibacter hurinus TaxID=2201324 RepID=A0A367GQ77_9SPHI|nr:BACON domain-containing carbohydrate-binding protein [Mucilaginibacter hurinus]RCH55614.1 hypothetical protein DJ568_06905 [Mucilaginibacter hurinus]
MNPLRLVTLTCAFLLICANATKAQQSFKETGIGFRETLKDSCISNRQRQMIITQLKSSTAKLVQQKVLRVRTHGVPVGKFIWPIKQSAGSTDPGYYGISNYVDENRGTGLRDFNCGTRTYEGHQGTDIFTWPFAWDKMDKNAVQIVAATKGTIIYKFDGADDKSCAFCTEYCDWNAVYVQNTDGSVCWYGHMKKGSVTTKPIGSIVNEGEYLGVVGSSGNSTGPHLHFEVYKDNTYQELLDPWAGSCNAGGNQSLWKKQQPYYVTTINKIVTGRSIPVLSQCYNATEAADNIATVFNDGDPMYFSMYFRDMQPDSVTRISLISPDGKPFFRGIFQKEAFHYSAFYRWFTVPVNPAGTGKHGIWQFIVDHKGQVVKQNFEVKSIFSADSVIFAGEGGQKSIQIRSSNAWSINKTYSGYTISPMSGNAGTTTVTITAQPNIGTVTKLTTIAVTVPGQSFDSRLSISQKPVFSNPLRFAATGGAHFVNLTTTQSWSISKLPDWISCKPMSGKGNTTLIVTAKSTGAARQGAITFAAASQSAPFTVRQDGPCNGSPSFAVYPEALNYAAGGGSVNVNADAFCCTGNIISLPSWIKVGTNGLKSKTGSGYLTFTASANTSGKARTGSIRFSFTNGSFAGSKTVTINQAANASAITAGEMLAVNSNAGISIYPTVVTNGQNVHIMSDKAIKKVQVSNLMGKQIISGRSNDVSLSGYPSGIYIFNVATADTVVTGKVIKE